jgi:hypothetical protein
VAQALELPCIRLVKLTHKDGDTYTATAAEANKVRIVVFILENYRQREFGD